MITGMERNGLDYRDIARFVKAFDRVFFGYIATAVNYLFVHVVGEENITAPIASIFAVAERIRKRLLCVRRSSLFCWDDRDERPEGFVD